MKKILLIIALVMLTGCSTVEQGYAVDYEITDKYNRIIQCQDHCPIKRMLPSLKSSIITVTCRRECVYYYLNQPDE